MVKATGSEIPQWMIESYAELERGRREQEILANLYPQPPDIIVPLLSFLNLQTESSPPEERTSANSH